MFYKTAVVVCCSVLCTFQTTAAVFFIDSIALKQYQSVYNFEQVGKSAQPTASFTLQDYWIDAHAQFRDGFLYQKSISIDVPNALIPNFDASAQVQYFYADVLWLEALNHLQNQNYFAAFRALKKSSKRVQSILNQHPEFIPAIQLNGLQQVLLGLVPNQAQWGLKLLGFEPNLKFGVTQLKACITPENPFLEELNLYFAVFQKLQVIVDAEIETELNLAHPIHCLCQHQYLKKSNTEALACAQQLKILNVPSADVYLARSAFNFGNYDMARNVLRPILQELNHPDYFKALQLLAWVGCVTNNQELIAETRILALNANQPNNDADAQIQQSIKLSQGLQPFFIQARANYDIGLYDSALVHLQTVNPDELNDVDQYRYHYRRCKIALKRQENNRFELLDSFTERYGDRKHYFIASAWLEGAYQAILMHDFDRAKRYATLALNHNYTYFKSAFDQKAKRYIKHVHSN